MSAELIQFNRKDAAASPTEKVEGLDWYSEVKQVTKAAGLPMLEELLCRKVTTVRTKALSHGLRSVDGESSFITLEAFVEGVEVPGRQGFEWAEWELKARAACIAKQYEVSPEFSPESVAGFMDMVEQELGRKPEDPKEFWHTLTTVDRSRAGQQVESLQSELSEESARRVEQEELAAERQVEARNAYSLLGKIPEDFSERFGSAENLISLYQTETEASQALRTELNDSIAELHEKASVIEELQQQAFAGLSGSSVDLRAYESALEEAEQAKRFLSKFQDRRNESKAQIEQQEQTISFLRQLNGRLTQTIKTKRAENEKLRAEKESGKALNKKLSGRIRAEKNLVAKSEGLIKVERQGKVQIMQELQRARRGKLVAFAGLVLVTSFSITLAAVLLTA